MLSVTFILYFIVFPPITENAYLIQLQLCLRGRNVMMGYLNKPEKTREAIDDEGWLHSGDLGMIDKVRLTSFVVLDEPKEKWYVVLAGQVINC